MAYAHLKDMEEAGGASPLGTASACSVALGILELFAVSLRAHHLGAPRLQTHYPWDYVLREAAVTHSLPVRLSGVPVCLAALSGKSPCAAAATSSPGRVDGR